MMHDIGPARLALEAIVVLPDLLGFALGEIVQRGVAAGEDLAQRGRPGKPMTFQPTRSLLPP